MYSILDSLFCHSTYLCMYSTAYSVSIYIHVPTYYSLECSQQFTAATMKPSIYSIASDRWFMAVLNECCQKKQKAVVHRIRRLLPYYLRHECIHAWRITSPYTLPQRNCCSMHNWVPFKAGNAYMWNVWPLHVWTTSRTTCCCEQWRAGPHNTHKGSGP